MIQVGSNRMKVYVSRVSSLLLQIKIPIETNFLLCSIFPSINRAVSGLNGKDFLGDAIYGITDG